MRRYIVLIDIVVIQLAETEQMALDVIKQALPKDITVVDEMAIPIPEEI